MTDWSDAHLLPDCRLVTIQTSSLCGYVFTLCLVCKTVSAYGFVKSTHFVFDNIIKRTILCSVLFNLGF